MGVYNAALLGGIATSETGLAHCNSEVSFGCPGPNSPSCGDQPILAGGADGPCSDMQGGLGMFQFDAGTYAQTISTYTDAILTVEGNTAQAVSFVVDKAILDIDGATDWMSATEWMNTVPMTAGDPVMERWATLMACRYNGCCSSSSLCTSRKNGYRDNAIAIYNDLGADFWKTGDRCTALPADGVIDQRSACTIAGGEPRFWRHEATGYGDSSEWTETTAAAKPSNFERWLVKPARATMYHLEVFVQGGEATAAKYKVHHAGTVDTVTIDQTTASDFVALGDFDLAGDGSEFVELGDNTGTANQKLVVDALRVTPLDGMDPGGSDGGVGGDDGGKVGGGGGCSTGGDSGGSVVLLLGLIALAARQRR
jgi:MYXO-CTERM domain-containing protein